MMRFPQGNRKEEDEKHLPRGWREKRQRVKENKDEGSEVEEQRVTDALHRKLLLYCGTCLTICRNSVLPSFYFFNTLRSYLPWKEICYVNLLAWKRYDD